MGQEVPDETYLPLPLLLLLLISPALPLLCHPERSVAQPKDLPYLQFPAHRSHLSTTNFASVVACSHGSLHFPNARHPERSEWTTVLVVAFCLSFRRNLLSAAKPRVLCEPRACSSPSSTPESSLLTRRRQLPRLELAINDVQQHRRQNYPRKLVPVKERKPKQRRGSAGIKPRKAQRDIRRGQKHHHPPGGAFAGLRVRSGLHAGKTITAGQERVGQVFWLDG